MADYDLGTAHGKIVIEDDRRASEATADALRKLNKNLQNLEAQVKALDKTMRESSRGFHNMADGAEHAADSIDELGDSTRRFNHEGQKNRNVVDNIQTGFKNTGAMALSAAIAIKDVAKSLANVRNLDWRDLAANSLKWAVAAQEVMHNTAALRKSIVLANGVAAKWNKTMVTVINTADRLSTTSKNLAATITRIGVAGNAARTGLLNSRLAMRRAAGDTDSYAARLKRLFDSQRQAQSGFATFKDTMSDFVGIGNMVALRFIRLGKAVGELPPAVQKVMQVLGSYLAIEGLIKSSWGSLANAGVNVVSKVRALAPTLNSMMLSIRGTVGLAGIVAKDMARIQFGKAVAGVRGLTSAIAGGVVAWTNYFKAVATSLPVVGGAIASMGQLSKAMIGGAAAWGNYAKLLLTTNPLITGTFHRVVGSMRLASGAVRTFGAGIGAAIAGFASLAVRAIASSAAFAVIRNRIMAVVGSMAIFARMSAGMIGGLSRMADGLLKGITGFALMRSSVKGITKFIDRLGAGMALAATAMSVLVSVSTGLVGLAKGLKDIAKIAYALPGLLTAAAIAGGVLFVAFKGVKAAFSAGLKDGQEFADALAKLPPGMQGVARAVNDVKGRFKELGNTITDGVFAGLEGDIRRISDAYLPMLNASIGKVTGGLNSIIQRFTSHLGSDQTLQAMNQAIGQTGIVLSNVSRAIAPVLDGLQIMGLAGLRSMAGLTRGLVNVTGGFRIWAKQMDATNGFEKGINRGIASLKNLGSILASIGGMAKDFFSAFAGNRADPFSRWAQSLKDVRANFQEALGTGKLDVFVQYFQKMMQYVQRGISTIVDGVSDISNAFGSTLADIGESVLVGFVAGLRDAVLVMKLLVGTLSAVPGAATFMGLAASVLALNKALEYGVKGFMRIGAAIYGAGSFMAGAVRGIGGYVAAVQAGTRGSDFMRKALDALKISALGAQLALGALMAVLMIAAVAFVAYNYKMSKQKAEQEELSRQTDQTAKAFLRFRDAVYAAGGAIDDVALDELGGMMESAKEKVEKRANDTPGAGTKTLDFLQRVGNGLNPTWGDSRQDIVGSSQTGNQMQAAADQAKRVKELMATDDELKKILSGSSDAYLNYEKQFQGLGDAGKEYIAELQRARGAMKEVSDAAARMGEPALNLSNALQKMGEAGASSADKLDALRSALTALGLLKTDAATAAMNFTEAVKKLGEEAMTAADSSGLFGTALLNAANGIGNGVSTMDANANALVKSLVEVSDNFLEQSVATGDATAAYDQLMPSLQKLADTYQIPIEKIKELAAQYGMVPGTVETLVALQGSDAVERGIAQVMLQFDALAQAGNKPIPIPIESQGAIDELRKINGLVVDTYNAATKEASIRIKPDANPEDVRKALQKWLSEHVDVPVDPTVAPSAITALENQINNNGQGYDVDARIKAVNADFMRELQANGPVDIANMSQEEVARNIDNNFAELERRQQAARAQGAPAPTAGQPGTPAAQQPQGQQPITPENAGQPVTKEVTIKVINADVAMGAINGITMALNSLRDKSVKLGISNADVALGAIQGVQNALSAMQDKMVRIGVSNADAALGAVRGVQQALDNLHDKSVRVGVENADVALGAVQGVIEGFNKLGEAADAAASRIEGAMQRGIAAINSVKGAITGVQDAMTTVANGALASGQSLGENFAAGIRSKTETVRQASMQLAQAASQPLPHSPAKIGPFSGKGWTPYRGRSLAEGFAKGIRDGSGGAKATALDLATVVSQALDTVAVNAKALKFQQTYFDANRTPGIGGKKYYRDPEITDEELAKQKRERKKQEAQDAKDEAYRQGKKAGANLPEQEEKVKKATERVTKAQEKLNKAKNEEERTKAQENLNEAIVAQGNAQRKLKEMQDSAAANPDAASAGASSATNDSIDNFVKSLDNAQYGMGAFNAAMLDCSAFVSAVANVASGRDPFSERANTTNLRPFLLARGFKEGQGGAGDLSIAWWDKGGGANGHAALTTGTGLNAESTTGGVRFGSGSAGARSNNSQFDQFMYLPLGGQKSLEKIEQNTASTASSVDTIALVQNPDGTYSAKNSEWNKLIQRESGGKKDIIQGVQDVNSGGNEASGLFQIAKGTWAANGGKEFAETAGQATAEQQAQIAAKIFKQSGAQPWGNRENEQALREGIVAGTAAATSGGSGAGGGATEETAEEQLRQLRAQNSKLDQNLKVLEDENSSLPEVIRALQDVDDTIASTEDPDIRDQLNQIRENTMTDRGLKLYDKKEGATEDYVATGISAAQTVFGIYNTIMSGIDNATELFSMLARGFENTRDINTFVDGVQSMAEAFSSLISSAGAIVDVVASIAAAAGSAIPGIGQVTGVLSAVTGGIGNVNAIIDLVQEGFQIAGRWIGTALSWLAGGVNGPLQGDVKALLDTNDGTLKTWSSDNPMDKRTHSLSDPFATQSYDPYGNATQNQFNIYANPNAPASELVNELGYAMRVSGSGAYSE